MISNVFRLSSLGEANIIPTHWAYGEESSKESGAQVWTDWYHLPMLVLGFEMDGTYGIEDGYDRIHVIRTRRTGDACLGVTVEREDVEYVGLVMASDLHDWFCAFAESHGWDTFDGSTDHYDWEHPDYSDLAAWLEMNDEVSKIIEDWCLSSALDITDTCTWADTL